MADLVLDGMSGEARWNGLILSGVGDLPIMDWPTLKSVKFESGPMLWPLSCPIPSDPTFISPLLDEVIAL